MWSKFDDEYPENRKVASVSAYATLLHVLAIMRCSRLESDGFLTQADMEIVLAMSKIPAASRQATVREAVDAKLLHDHGDRFEVHDFLDYNPSHEELEEKRASGAKRIKNWRRNGRRNKEGHGVSNGGSNAVTNMRPDPGSLSKKDHDPKQIEEPGTNGVSNSVTTAVTPIRPRGHDLVAMFGLMRLEVFPETLPWNTARDTKGDAGSFAALLSDDDIEDLKPTMRLALEKIKTGAPGWTNPELSVSPSFAFGKWKSDFTGLREELHGRAPKVERKQTHYPSLDGT